ncbi:MAG: preprotein translocase subunit SecY [Patescibacteria group bacterium]|nr:MAG: preprotein translocase subunit SecY [Patescibacteria group bacterium]
MMETLKKIWNQKDLRRKIIFTLAIIAVFRFFAHLPLPGVDREALRQLFSSNALLGLLSVFSGGAMENFSVVSLGLGPYINATIIFQLLTFGFPKLKEMAQEGEQGQAKINQYTRFLSLPLALLQGYGFYFLLRQQGVVASLGPFALLVLVITLAAGSVLSMWLGELISERGVGNGISLLIFIGIVAGYPLSLAQTFSTITGGQVSNLFLFILLFLAVFAGVVIIIEAVRRVPIHYSVRGPRSAVQSFLPLRINQAGVIPIIFAISLVLIPPTAARYLSGVDNPGVARLAEQIVQLFEPTSFLYNILYFLLVFLFTFFYTAVIFNIEDISENLQRQGSFIPGIRPGRATVDFLNRVMTRITFSGGIFLGLMAILPSVAAAVTGITSFTLGGTGILIIVPVVLETLRQIEGDLSVREYEGYL